MGFWYPERSKDAGQKSAAIIEVRVNGTFNVGGDPKIDELGREMYFERERTDTVPFTTPVYERLSPTERSITHVWLTAGGELPWRQASREEYQALIFDFEGKNGEKLAKYRNAMAKTPYEQWLEGAPQRKKELEEALKGRTRHSGRRTRIWIGGRSTGCSSSSADGPVIVTARRRRGVG